MTAMTFTYTNWRGETAPRRVLPLRVRWGTTEWHPDAQWLMDATDLDRNTLRTFAMSGMKNIGGTP